MELDNIMLSEATGLKTRNATCTLFFIYVYVTYEDGDGGEYECMNARAEVWGS